MIKKNSTLGELLHRIMIMWEKYITAYGKSVKDGYKSNAFDPLVWFVIFLIIPFIVVVLASSNEIIKYLSLGFIFVIVIFSLVMYVILLCKDPKLLQSEWYRLENRRLDLISQQGNEKPKLPEELNSGYEIEGGAEE